MELQISKLSAFLEDAVPGFAGLKKAEKFSGGQSNPTYKLTAQSGVYVLRRKPPGKLLKSAHAVDREYRVLKALAQTDVPVGEVFVLCTDTTIIGSEFYLMEFLEGDVYWDPKLPDLSNDDRRKIYAELNKTLAAIHGVNVDAVGLGDFGKPGNYFERQIARWSKQYRAAETEKISAMDSLIRWLEDNCVSDDGCVTLVHGDYRLDNVMFTKERRALGVMDWELSTLGHPIADLAYQCMQWRLPDDPLSKGLGGVKRETLGIPSEASYVGDYCRRRAIPTIDNWEFYLAFSFFRLAAILQGVKKRAIDGNASNETAAKLGAFVQPMAEQAMNITVDGA